MLPEIQVGHLIRFQPALSCGVKWVFQFLLLSTLGLAACRPAGPKLLEAPKIADLPPFDPATQVTVSYLDLEHVGHFLESNPEALLLDVRTRGEYDEGHLPKALSFPYDFENQTIDGVLEAHPDLDSKKICFIYGSKENYYAVQVIVRLRSKGYQYLFCMNGGIEDWVEKGLPLMSGDMD